MAGIGYKVLTEFRFDVANAVASSQTLQNEVGKISGAADQANFALRRVGIGLAYQMGIGQGGFLGAVYTALKASDKFAESQRQIANIFLSNNMFQGAFGFENAMTNASIALENMKKSAREFSLPVQALVNTSKLIGASLINHGLDDGRLTASTNLARGFLKSAPTLGVDPGLAQGQLLDAVMGRANMGDTLVQRLFNETTAMKQFAPKPGAKTSGGGAAAFNALDPAKRLEVLTKALMQFGSNSRILEENTKSLSGQLLRLSDNITGMFSVLKPIGDALMKPVKEILYKINGFLETDGEKIVQNFSGIIKKIFADPEKLFVNIQQARRLDKDVKLAGQGLLMMSLAQGLTWVMQKLGFEMTGGLFATGLRYLGITLLGLGALIGVTFLAALAAVAAVMVYVLPPLLAMVFFMQILSRAMAKAQVSNAKWLVDKLPLMSELFAKFSKAISNIFLPITMAMEFWSDLIAWIFRLDVSGNILLGFFGKLTNVFTFLGVIIVGALSLISGAMSVIMGAFLDLSQGNFMQMGKNFGKNFDDGFNEVFAKRYQRYGMGIDDSSVSNKVTNIDKIEINNQFKEQMEPDRIAFMLKEQLVKAALNPQQATGRSLRGGLVGQ